MMMPSVLGENLFDDWFNTRFMDDFKSSIFGKREKNLMKTDIKEQDGNYCLDMDLPGFKKEEIDVQLKDGYLMITASKGIEKDEKGEDGAYIRRERYTGQCSRNFYVGKAVKAENMKAAFQDGILHMEFPKVDDRIPEEQQRVLIE